MSAADIPVGLILIAAALITLTIWAIRGIRRARHALSPKAIAAILARPGTEQDDVYDWLSDPDSGLSA